MDAGHRYSVTNSVVLLSPVDAGSRYSATTSVPHNVCKVYQNRAIVVVIGCSAGRYCMQNEPKHKYSQGRIATVCDGGSKSLLRVR